jgi:exodeoxyribonuclease VII large subunit
VIYFRETLVQGDEAKFDIVNAIQELNQVPLDVIIVGRGGGSLEDLWAFNEEIVARAIFNSRIPIISAVGHETDFTIADFVADKRAPTPTAAAELATPKTIDMLLEEVDFLFGELHNKVLSLIENYSDEIKYLINSYAFKKIEDRVAYYRQYLDELDERFHNVSTRFLQRRREILENNARHLALLNPMEPLERGYALLKHKDKLLDNSVSLSKFKSIEVIRKEETAVVRVEKVNRNLFV